MSTVSVSPSRPVLNTPRRRWLRAGVILLSVSSLVALGVFYGMRAWSDITGVKKDIIPVAKVVRGDVTLDVSARGELRGGNPEMLTAPMTGGLDMHLTTLLDSGEPVKAGEIVAEFDTTEQEYKLREAQADLAETGQRLIQAKAMKEAQAEEDRYALQKAATDVRLAELDVRKNPLLPSLTARQNTIALEAAKDHLVQLQHNLTNRKATDDAAIAIQEAARLKAESQAKTAQLNIDAMTLRAHRDGYVSILQNTNQNQTFFGMTLPAYQLGDTVRPGMAFAQIPDLKNWEVAAKISELDRGHISLGQSTILRIVAVPGHAYHGKVREMGGASGPAWDRSFECRIALDDPSVELRPGMSSNIVITTDQMKGVLSLPAQALFESDGRTFVYVQTPGGFVAKDVTLVRRNEMKVVITGLDEGQFVALSNPTEAAKKKSASGAMQALPK